MSRMQLFLYHFVILSAASSCFGFGFSSIGNALSNAMHSVVCNLKECCNDRGIPADFNGLRRTLQKRVYGQHLVEDIVVAALKSHWEGTYKPSKALTLSFHGWPGGGKNYVSRFIIENMYAAGGSSKFVHQFIGRTHFPSAGKVTQYQQDLQRWIKGNVTICPKQMFVFDEVDKMPPMVLNIIKPMIDYRDNVDGVDYRECVFIFLSNTGAALINEHFMETWKTKGVTREDLRLRDFETLILKGAFNEEGGFQFCDAIKSNLIDHYIPFLPMERRHVKLCILDEFKQRNVSDPTQEQITETMEFIEWGPSSERIFSLTGCKRISQKVGTIVAKYKLRDEL